MRGTQDFDIICVGHSLGARTATILAIMLKQDVLLTRSIPPIDVDVFMLAGTDILFRYC